MSTATRVLKNTGILYVKVGISAICTIFSTRFVLQALGIDDFGIYNIVGSVIIMLSFLNESMATATQRFMSFSEGQGQLHKLKVVFNVSVILHTLIALFIAILLILIGLFIFDKVLTIPENRIVAAKYVYYFMIGSAILSMITVPYNAVLIAHENMLYYSIIGSILVILKLLIAVYLLYFNLDRLILYGILMASISLIEFVIVRIYCYIKYVECKINFKKYYDKDLLKEMTGFAGWQLLYSSSSILSIQGTSILLNYFFGIVVNAAQGIARQLTGQLMLFSNTLLNALNPVIVKSAGAGENANMINYTLIGSKLSYLLLVVFSVPVLVEMPYLLDVWLDKVPDYAVVFCRFEIIQQLIASLTVTLVTSISAKGDIKAFQIFSTITYFVRLPIIFICLKLGYNPISVYYVSTATVILLCIGRVYFATIKSGLNVSVYLKEVIYPSILLTTLMFITVMPISYLMQISLLRLVSVTLVSTMMLLVSLKFFALTLYEKKLIGNAITTIKNHVKR